MRFAFAAVFVALFLTGCQTTRQLASQALPAGHGGGLLQMCFANRAAQRNFTLLAQKIEPGAERIEYGAGAHTLKKTLRLQDTTNVADSFLAWKRRDCTFWQFTAPAGEYAIVSFRETQSTALPPGASVLGAALAAIVVATAKNDQFAFVDDSGNLKQDTPTFSIQPGKTLHFGSIVYTTDSEDRDVPRLDSKGTWDGQSTDRVAVRRYRATYQPAGSGTDDTKAVAGDYEAGLPRQIISNLEGRTIVVEDFPEEAPLPE